jgi:hypothetical protein
LENGIGNRSEEKQKEQSGKCDQNHHRIEIEIWSENRSTEILVGKKIERKQMEPSEAAIGYSDW